ncbi:phage tail protein [Amycolatopsis sp. cmx-4-61]|uniref:phage tail protein n=1 Tax=Amycolatopsis sp. cmx-4-61 TaxID=2790937 RepID=UPI00397890E2
MRGAVDGLRSPHPIVEFLPAVFQEDEGIRRWVAGLDDVLAPALASLDCLVAYLDPMSAPADFLELLAAWTGVELDENWPLDRQRSTVAHAAELHRVRGTAYGLQWQLDMLTDGRARLHDAGGVTWSQSPTDDTDHQPPRRLVIEVSADLSPEEVSAVRELVEWAKPAHVAHHVVVRG